MVAPLPFGFAKRHQVFLDTSGEQPVACFSPKAKPQSLAEAQRFVGQLIDFRKLEQAVFDQALSSQYANGPSSAESLATDLGEQASLSLADAVPQATELMEQEDDAPVIRLINAMLSEAIKAYASDIHLEVFDQRMSIRFRVDGVLQEVLQPPRHLASLLISRLKVMARLDIAEKRLPQDGRIGLKLAGREIDVRVSTLPSNDSERVVLRLLEKQLGRLEFGSLGMEQEDIERITRVLRRPHGMLLVTGPTGSGKSTTLYAGLQSIQTGQLNILTIEDPVEYDLSGIGQTQVNTKAGMTFAKGLRAILRQDPDVVMIGEIRDLETAQIAIQASLTGHLVLSTLHTNTALGAITRLDDMGVEPFLVSSSLAGVLAQRLVRVLCPHCKRAYPACPADLSFLAASSHSEFTLYEAVGCERCRHTGYQGRTGIYELILITDELRALIHDRASEATLTKAARASASGIIADGRDKVLKGVTTIAEVLRVTQEN